MNTAIAAFPFFEAPDVEMAFGCPIERYLDVSKGDAETLLKLLPEEAQMTQMLINQGNLGEERDLVITIGDEVHEFDPDALVVDSFRIDFGSGTLDLNMLNDGTDGEYTILGLIDCPGDPIAETLQVRLQQA